MKKRLHPVRIVISIIHLVKNAVFPALFLFVFHQAAEAAWVIWARYAFFAYILVTICGSIFTWWTLRYEFRGHALYLYTGIFVKSQRRVPLERIQNAHRHTPFVHKLFRVTALSLETGGDEASVKLDTLTVKEADRIEERLKGKEAAQETKAFHFKVTGRELFKASFTSFSFFAIIPLLGSVYFTIDDFFELGGLARETAAYIKAALWLLIPISLILFLLGAAVGIVMTYLRYGSFEIMSDDERIYLKKGILNETFFTITKEKVQAVKWKQPLLKRLFKLVEVELISAGDTGEEELETNSLFPFLPAREAARIVEELLPAYRIEPCMEKLPRTALWVKLIRPSWVWIVATAALLWWQPAYWYGSPVLLVLLMAGRWLEFKQARYLVNGAFLQIKSGILSTELLVTPREKIQEIEVKESWLQRRWRVATIQIANRARPVHYSQLADVPVGTAALFYQWYAGRK
ncbi:PH domain-containing protein [Domibacillus indicus]|uniref:PH domain-containing protein n=1 Tax=Domibacillus indicus TaxID=1437523 RepID=UPI0006973C81|nr:PH domain-containing protein [Domibacillus indicus]